MLIKICGLSSHETIAAAAEAGASHVGLVHFEPSPRHVSLDDAARLRASVPAGVKVVLLLVDPDADLVARAADTIRPDVIQFHGKETPDAIAAFREISATEIWKALPVRSAETLAGAAKYAGIVDRLLFDAPPPSAASVLPGGNGVGFDWSLLKGHEHRVPWGLAGGLNPGNVADAVRVTGASLVDASSGLESAPGVKDVDRIAAFCKAALET
jgi:phosphoribosylanthranilate isomerase